MPWWGPANADVTLQRILVHMIAETAHHAGQADIVREMLLDAPPTQDPNLPGWNAEQWAAYRARLQQIAERRSIRAEVCEPVGARAPDLGGVDPLAARRSGATGVSSTSCVSSAEHRETPGQAFRRAELRRAA